MRTKKQRTLTIKKYKACRSVASKALGLMFRTRVNIPYIFFFSKEQIVSLHMFFVFMPIDVIFLNKDREVVELKTLRPFQTYTPKNKSKYVIETKKGEIKKNNIKIKNKFKFIF